MYQTSLIGFSTLSVLNYIVPPTLKPRRFLWAPEVLKVSELLCAASFSCPTCFRLPCTHFNKYFIFITTYEGPTLCKPLYKALGVQRERAPVNSQRSARFHSSLFQTVPCTAARVPVLSPKDGLVTPALSTPATAPTAFRGRLGSWTWSAGDNPCYPQVLPPAASPSRFSSWASVLLPTGLLSACQVWLFPSILRTWGVCVLCWGAPASPCPLGNCCLIWGDHLSGLFLTR